MYSWVIKQWQMLDRLAQTRVFKLAASAVVILAAIAVVAVYSLREKSNPNYKIENPTPAVATETAAPADPSKVGSVDETGKPLVDVGLESSVRAINQILQAKDDPTQIAVAAAEVAGIALVIIWLGLTFVYLLLALLGIAAFFIATWLQIPAAGQLIAGCLILSAAFTALLAGVRMLLSGSHPVIAIARNILTEAIRMKASLVFMVLLVLMLCLLPQWLDSHSPLRYRVQTVLQFGTGISFWIIALLVMLLTLSSICFEQRDKVIWQTMTKPVQSWQYLLGKWIGVVCLSGVLLTVCASGVFLFTEYLRGQPAINESVPYVDKDGAPISEDRKILETQVLVAREAVRAELPEFDESKLNNTIVEVVKRERLANPEFGLDPRDPSDHEAIDPQVRAKVRADLMKIYTEMFRTLEPGQSETYRFVGLHAAKAIGLPLVLKYRVDSGSNRPDQVFKLTFAFSRTEPFVREVILGQDLVLLLPPTVIEDSGEASVTVFNGDALYTRTPNDATIMFPKGGLEMSYPVASYRNNYIRVMFILWVKLAFLAMVAVFCSTFMSFPVAALVTLGVFFSAETTSFLFNALDYYDAVDEQGKLSIIRFIVRNISLGVAYMFKAYADLKPVERLVQGELIPVIDVALGVIGLGLASIGLFAFASFIFQRRELATYSGQ